MRKLSVVFAALAFTMGMPVIAQSTVPLKLMAKYPMPATVQGRFDHLGADLQGNRLFLAAETAHEVLIFNLQNGKFIRAITGIAIPHAIFVRDDLDHIYITDGGTGAAGALRIYDGKTYRLLKTAPLKRDTDSIGYDARTKDLYIDDGGGDAHESFSMLSAVNTTSGEKVADIKIDGETLEAMALEKSSPRMYVNNAAKNQISVVDRKSGSVVASWPVTSCMRNVSMALDEAGHRLFVACRSGQIAVFDTRTGKQLQTLPIAQGVDDLIFDPASKRIYASCGAGNGSTSVYREQDPDHYKLLGDVATAPGAKNEVLVSRLGRYFVAVPPRQGSPGQIYAYQVQ